MQNTKVDPRITLTRRLLTDAFLKLTSKKDFQDITIKDITDEAFEKDLTRFLESLVIVASILKREFEVMKTKSLFPEQNRAFKLLKLSKSYLIKS